MHEQDTTDLLLEWVRTHYFGKYSGTVVDNDDPLQKGRLKVAVPDLFGPGVGVWALPCVPYAGPQVGFKMLPEAGANVWIEFEKGDISHPVWTGFFWGDGEFPAEGGSGGTVKLWKTGALMIRIDDDAGELIIEATGGARLTLAAGITGEAGSASIAIAADGVMVDAGRTIEVTQVSVRVNGGALEVS